MAIVNLQFKDGNDILTIFYTTNILKHPPTQQPVAAILDPKLSKRKGTSLLPEIFSRAH